MARGKRRSSLAHRGEQALFRFAEKMASTRSWEERVSLGARLGRIWHAVDLRHRQVARQNAARAFPDWSRAQVRNCVRRNFEHLGVTAVEFLGLASVSREELVARTRLEGLEHLHEALALGKGVLVLTGHLGNWELAGAAAAARDYPFFAVGRRQANPLLDARVNEIRERFGGRVIAHRNAVRPVMRALREGGLVAFLMDQKALLREAVLSTFFGQPVATNQGLALLALKTGAPVVPGFDERVGGQHVMRVWPALEPPGEGSREQRVEAFTRAIDGAIEAAVRRRPEQWFWVHRRWRLPGGLGP